MICLARKSWFLIPPNKTVCHQFWPPKFRETALAWYYREERPLHLNIKYTPCRVIVHQNPDLLLKHKEKYVEKQKNIYFLSENSFLLDARRFFFFFLFYFIFIAAFFVVVTVVCLLRAKKRGIECDLIVIGVAWMPLLVAARAVLFYFFFSADPFLVTRSRDRITSTLCMQYACHAMVYKCCRTITKNDVDDDGDNVAAAAVVVVTTTTTTTTIEELVYFLNTFIQFYHITPVPSTHSLF